MGRKSTLAVRSEVGEELVSFISRLFNIYHWGGMTSFHNTYLFDEVYRCFLPRLEDSSCLHDST